MAPFFEQDRVISAGHMRPARFKGSWYPANPTELVGMILKAWNIDPDRAGFSNAGNPEPGGPSQKRRPGAGGLLLPHPGLFYGIGTQAAGLRAAFPRREDLGEGSATVDPDHILLLSPSHYSRLEPGTLYGWPYDGLECPLGTLLHSLPASPIPGMVHDRDVTDAEHGLETILPILAWRFPHALFTLLVCGPTRDWSQVQDMAAALQNLVQAMSPKSPEQSRVLLVASSDMTHWGMRFGDPLPRPKGASMEEMEQTVLARDRAALALLDRQGPELLKRRTELAPTMCGLIPALVVSAYLDSPARLLAQSSSLEKTLQQEPRNQNSDGFVSYAALCWSPREFHHG